MSRMTSMLRKRFAMIGSRDGISRQDHDSRHLLLWYGVALLLPVLLLASGYVFFEGYRDIYQMVFPGILTIIVLLAVWHTLARLNRQVAELRNSQNELQATLDALAEGVLMIDSRQGIRRANRKAASFWGCSIDDILASTLNDLFPDGLGRRGEDKDEDDQTRFNTVQIKRRNGTRRQVHLRLNHALIDGERRLILAVEDISRTEAARQARRESEAQLRLVIDALPLGIAYVDRGQCYRYANTRYAQRFDRAAGSLVGCLVKDVLDVEIYPTVAARIQAALRGESQQWDTVVSRPAKTVHLTLSYTPHRDAGGTVQGYLVMAQDITARKQQELALQDALHRADDANRFIRHFIANISHEIRTPLNALVGFSEILVLDDGADRQRCLQGIQRSTQTLLQWFDDVLFISRLAAADVQLRSESVDLRELVESVLNSFNEEAANRQLYLRAETAGLDQPIKLDTRLLRQALLKLLANAVKFTDHGGVTISGQLCPEPGGENLSLLLDVVDTGPGIDLALQTSIFELFRLGDDSSTRRHGGSGMGLGVCQHLVALLGGHLELESNPGTGSRFRICIPAVAVSSEFSTGKDLHAVSASEMPPVGTEQNINNAAETPLLSDAIYDELLTTLDELSRQKRFSRIRMFARRLQELAESEGLAALGDAGDRLAGAVRLGQIGQINRLLKNLPGELQSYRCQAP